MPERDGYQNGTPSWVDLGALDIPAMTEFYDMVFGWTMEAAGPPELTGGYGMFTQNGKVVAGIGPHQDPASKPGWSTYIAVDDCDKTVELAKGAGATVVVEPMDVMTAGRMAFLVDPQGAVFGVWQAGDHKGAQLVNEPGSLCWNEVITPDMDASLAFYGQVFGWQAAPFDAGAATEGPAYTMLMLGENGIGGAMQEPVAGLGDTGPMWLTTFAVADCDAAAAAVKANGGSIVVAPSDMSVGRSAVCRDPQGAIFQIIKLNPTE